MIVLRELTKTFNVDGHRRAIIDRASAVFPTGVSVALLGRNGAGKSTLLSLIAGVMPPSSGEILTDGRISYPVGYAGSFHPELTGAQNTRFVARIYGADTAELMDFVQDFSELGDHFHMPVRSYSSGMRSRLALAVTMGVGFDTYLVDEITAVGDARFRRKTQAIFADRMRTASALFVSHSMSQVREFCQAGAVINEGRVEYYPDLEDAIARHMELQGV